MSSVPYSCWWYSVATLKKKKKEKKGWLKNESQYKNKTTLVTLWIRDHIYLLCDVICAIVWSEDNTNYQI